MSQDIRRADSDQTGVATRRGPVPRRSGFAFPFARTCRNTTDLMVGVAASSFKVGDRCRTIHPVTMRAEEHFESEFMADLLAGESVVVIKVGTGRRIKVAVEGMQGWLSCMTTYGDILVAVREDMEHPCMGDVLAAAFKAGEKYILKSSAVMRTDESLLSEAVTTLEPGTWLKIMEFGASRRRVKIAVAMPGRLEGWISLATEGGDLLVNATPRQYQEVSRQSRSRHTVNAVLKAGGFRMRSLLRATPRQLDRNTAELEEALCALANAVTAIKLQTFRYGQSDSVVPEDDQQTCSICLQEFQTEEEVARLPCGHQFHILCVGPWVEKGNKCPMRCRKDHLRD